MICGVGEDNFNSIDQDERIKEVVLDTRRHCQPRRQNPENGFLIYHSSSEEKVYD
jgi:hypothetical protein